MVNDEHQAMKRLTQPVGRCEVPGHVGVLALAADKRSIKRVEDHEGRPDVLGLYATDKLRHVLGEVEPRRPNKQRHPLDMVLKMMPAVGHGAF